LSNREVLPHRQPLIDYLGCLLDQDMDTLFSIIDVCHRELILESQDEHAVWDEFKTVLFIAAKANKIFK